jgi:hypothetical protein
MINFYVKLFINDTWTMPQTLLDKILSLLMSENASVSGINESGSLLPLLQKLDSQSATAYDKDKVLLHAEGLR